jgi:hypothetical protein
VIKTAQQMIDVMHLMYDDIYSNLIKLADKTAAA